MTADPAELCDRRYLLRMLYHEWLNGDRDTVTLSPDTLSALPLPEGALDVLWETQAEDIDDGEKRERIGAFLEDAELLRMGLILAPALIPISAGRGQEQGKVELLASMDWRSYHDLVKAALRIQSGEPRHLFGGEPESNNWRRNALNAILKDPAIEPGIVTKALSGILSDCISCMNDLTPQRQEDLLPDTPRYEMPYPNYRGDVQFVFPEAAGRIGLEYRMLSRVISYREAVAKPSDVLEAVTATLDIVLPWDFRQELPRELNKRISAPLGLDVDAVCDIRDEWRLWLRKPKYAPPQSAPRRPGGDQARRTAEEEAQAGTPPSE